MISNFYWVIEGEIAGMAFPTAVSGYGDLENAESATPEEKRRELNELKQMGIGAVVTLTEQALSSYKFKEVGMEYLHLPVPDMTAPTQSQIREFIDFAHGNIENDRAVVVHCLGGSGRTGTMIACYLISRGYACKDAIEAVRRAKPGAIESHFQREAIDQYALNRKWPENGFDMLL